MSTKFAVGDWRGEFRASEYLIDAIYQRGLTIIDVGKYNSVMARLSYRAEDMYIPLKDWYQKRTNRRLSAAIIQAPQEGISLARLAQLCCDGNEGAAAQKIQFLESESLVESTGPAAWRCTKELDNFGPTFTKIVAETLYHDLAIPTLWDVKIGGVKENDYDVLGLSEGRLIYVECKSSTTAPSQTEVNHFLRRVEEISPMMAILLLDGDGAARGAAEAADAVIEWDQHLQFDRLPSDYGDAYVGLGQIYIAGTGRRIETALRRCIQHYYQQMWRRRQVPTDDVV